MSDEETRINPGYPLAQLLKAMSSKGKKAKERVTRWQQVIAGILDGSLQIGSRTPVKNTPGWVTLNVVHGGFATGGFAASGPLTAYERDMLQSLNVSAFDPAVELEVARSALNTYFIGDAGRAQLSTILKNGCFRIQVPEEGALLIAIWLMNNNQTERATSLIETLMPYFPLLRFYPIPHDNRAHAGPGVYLYTAYDAVQLLQAKSPQRSVQQMNEAIAVWTPLYDRAVSLFLETVEGDTPQFAVNESGDLLRAANGQPIVSGGWPCRIYADGWALRAAALLKEYRAARAINWRCRKPEKRKENFTRLRGYLAQILEEPKSLSGRDVGMIRKILASYVTTHGAPGSKKLQDTRAAQEAMAKRPLHVDLAAVLAKRLSELQEDEGLPNVRDFLGPLSPEEASSIHGVEGQEIPPSLLAKAMRCLEAPLADLVEAQIVSSGEVMAKVLPLLTARILTSAVEERQLAPVFEGVYRAFRKRRSLLLLNLEHQIRFEELPWISAVQPWTGSKKSSAEAARAALTQAATLAIEAFPETILPNKLVREFRALAASAGMSIPLVDELAADIFMGSFSGSFLRAAQEAAKLLEGTLYERYYGLDYNWVSRIDDIREEKHKTPTSKGFALLCSQLASVNRGNAPTQASFVASNGTVIEQSQILTTHNLASLFNALDLAQTVSSKLPTSARECFKTICRHHQMKLTAGRIELRAIKNSAYAWRQMIFYLSLLNQAEVDEFHSWSFEYLYSQKEEFWRRFEPAVKGLHLISSGQQFDKDGTHPSGARRFLGWSCGPHWLRQHKVGLGVDV